MNAVNQKWLDLSVALGKWLFTFLLAFHGAKLVWLIVDQPVLVLPAAKTQQADGGAQGQIYDMASWDLFGKAEEAPVAQAEAIDAPKTRLRLSLLGVFTAKNPNQSSAIIAEQGREGEFFKVGDRVQGRTRLTQVFEDKVILDNNGKLETLTFDETRSTQGFVAQKRVEKPKPSNVRRDFKKELRQVRTPAQFVDFAKQQLEDPQAAMDNLGLKATGDGYVLDSSASMLMSIGMKKGDKLISINGRQLCDPTQDKLIIDEVYSSGSASIVIERGSRRMTINHSF